MSRFTVAMDSVATKKKKKHMQLDYNALLMLFRETLAGVDEKADPRKLFPGADGGCFYLTANGPVSLSEEATRAFQQFLRALSHDPQIDARVSMWTISTQAAELLVQLAESPSIPDEDLASQIKTLAARLRASVSDWHVFLPLDNIRLRGMKKVKIGRVTLHEQESCLKALKRSIAASMRAKPHITATVKREHRSLLEQYLERDYESSEVIAEVVVTADEDAASGLAEQEASTALNLLRLYTPLLYARNRTPTIGLRGANPIARRPHAMRNAQHTTWSYGGKKHGSLDTYELTADMLKHIQKRCSFSILSSLLAKTEMTTMESVLARGVRWIGQGILAAEVPSKVLNYAVALELLMTEGAERKNEGSITYQVANRLAHLLGKNPQDRAKMFSQAKDLYDLRSNVAHAGETDIAAEDVIKLETYTVRAILRLAKNLYRWPEHKDFRDWVRNREFR